MIAVTPPSSAIRAPSALIAELAPRAPAPIATASAAIPGSASGARKTHTMSTGTGTSSRLA